MRTPSESVRSRGAWRRIRYGVGLAACVIAVVGATSGTATAAPGDTATGSTDASVTVTSAIALTGLTPAFNLEGLPGTTMTGLGEVGYTVTTNNTGGYSVTVQSAAPVLAAGTGGNADSIPISTLGVRESGSTDFTPLSDTTPVLVHTQDTRSSVDGDTQSDDFELTVPFVNEDTYTATLNYVATAL